MMIFSEVETHYINSNTDSRLVRYDVIRIDDDTFVVNVFDVQQRSASPSGSFTNSATLKITRDDYESENNIGSSSVVRNRMPTTFQNHILVKCQQHRDSLDLA
ncbi:hypothetical protein SC127_14900 [Pantoea sp. T14]|uniref:hypothetical protein n=1 Tax=Pantoea sp. T14 TaxID=3085685 RepID=UPI002FC7D3F7